MYGLVPEIEYNLDEIEEQFFTKIIKNTCTNQKKCVSLRVFIA